MVFGRTNVQRPLFVLVCGSILLLTLRYITTPSVIQIQDSVSHKNDGEPEPLIDNSASLSEDALIETIEKTATNLPVSFWKKVRYSKLKLNKTCAFFPKLLQLQFHNIYWQTLVTSNGTFQLLAAYLDNRKYNKESPTVRLLGMINRIEPNVTTYCQIWFEKKYLPVITKSSYTYIWRKEWTQHVEGDYEAYLISCNVPKSSSKITPVAVSLVERECDTASNLLKILYNHIEPKKDFAVCVKGLDYPDVDISVRLVEWIEFLNILGADMIHFYKFGVHPNVSKVLDYYEKQGKVQVTPFLLAGGQPNLPALRTYYFKQYIQRKRVNEMLPYNDCFYQHMYEYKFIILLDIDEVIVPNKVNSWKELIAQVQTNLMRPQASYSAQNLYFLDNAQHGHKSFEGIPKYMHMLQHVYRTVNFTIGEYVKSFFNTEYVLTLHNHYPLACLNDCPMYDISLQYAQLQHYRNDCVRELKKKCSDLRNKTVMDTNIWRYKETLIKRVKETLGKLNFI